MAVLGSSIFVVFFSHSPLWFLRDLPAVWVSLAECCVVQTTDMLTFLSYTRWGRPCVKFTSSKDPSGCSYSIVFKLKQGSGPTVCNLLLWFLALHEFLIALSLCTMSVFISVSMWLSKYKCRILMSNISGCHHSGSFPIHSFSCGVVKITAARKNCHVILELDLSNNSSSFQSEEFPLHRALSKWT